MSRTANSSIKNATQRNRLKARTAPYFSTIAPRRLLGYIRKGGETVAGSWVVRVEIGRTATGPLRRRETLGTADDIAVANGTDILNYEQALARAGAWNPIETSGPRAFTVADAVEQHRDFGGKKKNKGKTERAKLGAYNNLRYNVLRLDSDGNPREGAKGLGAVAVNDLTAAQLTAWRDAWVQESSAATALRNWTNLHSCLEQAAAVKANGITNTVWRSPERGGEVPAMDQEFEGRQLHFTNDEALAIIAAARAIDADVADYFEALYRTGARPGGELLDRTVGDFVNRRVCIPARNEENRSKTGKREVSLDAHGVALFQRLTAGRTSTAPLLTPCDERGRIKAVMVAAVQSVLPEVKAEDIVPYAFRHTFISRRLEAGMPMSLVAVHCGTSEHMIRKTYAKFCPSETERWLAETAPQPMLQVVKNEEQRVAA